MGLTFGFAARKHKSEFPAEESIQGAVRVATSIKTQASVISPEILRGFQKEEIKKTNEHHRH